MKITPFSFPEEWEQIRLYTAADIHDGDKCTDIKAVKEFVKVVKNDPCGLAIYNGDGMNVALADSPSDSFDDTFGPKRQVEELTDILFPIKDKFLSAVGGNHDYTRSKKKTDITPMDLLVANLGWQKIYNPIAGAIKITFGKAKLNGKPISYGIYNIHGKGGGSTGGAALNKVEKLAYSVEGVDVVIVSHFHKEIGERISAMRFDLHNNQVIQTDKICVISAAWQDYFGGYAQQAMMNPAPKIAEPILLDGRIKRARAII